MDEIDEVVQDCYMLISRLDQVDHIRNGRNYLFQTAKSVILMKVRREKIVPIDRLVEIDNLPVADQTPDPEQQASAHQELDRVRRIIANLPARCREIFMMRRIEGISQRQIAKHMGVSEAVVEQQAIRGLKLILKAIAEEEASVEAVLEAACTGKAHRDAQQG